MATEASSVTHDRYGNRVAYDQFGNPEVLLEPMTLAEWRRERIAPRLAQLGWNIPQLDQLEGFRLFQLERLLKEAGMLCGFEGRPLPGSVGDVLSAAPVGGTKPTKDAQLHQLRKAAEALAVECEFNQTHAKPRREAREKHEERMREDAANIVAAQNPGSKKASKLLEAMDGYHP